MENDVSENLHYSKILFDEKKFLKRRDTVWVNCLQVGFECPGSIKTFGKLETRGSARADGLTDTLSDLMVQTLLGILTPSENSSRFLGHTTPRKVKYNFNSLNLMTQTIVIQLHILFLYTLYSWGFFLRGWQMF